jgi:hypothetical protein
MQLLDDTVKKYGFSIEELGPKFAAQKLDEQAQELFKDFKVLQRGGFALPTPSGETPVAPTSNLLSFPSDRALAVGPSQTETPQAVVAAIDRLAQGLAIDRAELPKQIARATRDAVQTAGLRR